MRALAPADISVAARALFCLPEAAREYAITRIVNEAEVADRYRKRLDRGHPLYGNGSLEGAARCRPLADPKSLSDREYLSCLAIVLDALLERRRAMHR